MLLKYIKVKRMNLVLGFKRRFKRPKYKEYNQPNIRHYEDKKISKIYNQ